jgi:hypothetical protein
MLEEIGGVGSAHGMKVRVDGQRGALGCYSD